MTEPRNPPYPADTRAKGWRFELDYEKIEQSSTWGLAAEVPMAQHALLMMWLVAWRQEPCGTFPDDEEVIRAKCRIPPRAWGQLRPILMRGWWSAADGLLYHDTITARVLEMLAKRASDAKRSADRRARQADADADHAGVTRDAQRTPPGVRPESGTDHLPPTTKVSKPSASHPAARGLRFPEFWLAWPQGERKQDKAKCLEHWKRKDLDAVADAILADVRAKRGTEKWRDGFIEAPLVYLHGKRWEDGVVPATHDNLAKAQEQSAALLAQMEADRQASQTPESRAAAQKVRGLISGGVIKRAA